MKRFFLIVSIALACAALTFAQNSNSSTTSPSSRSRVVEPKPTPPPKTVSKSSNATAKPSPSPTTRGNSASGSTAPSTGVLAAFDKIIEGIRKSDVDLYMSGYWNSPQLILFNYNGTVTRGWDQLKKNRESSFPLSTDVKLDIKDRHVTMLGTGGAVVTCLWTQSMTFRGTPETDTGRMTLVFRRVGNEWKAVHLHTSPDKPDPTRVPASEQPTP
ncbi:MAG TPA: nuclear transport factor 2 family protein [Pyrinomonadaceae bacterium]|nr:nuclear transport factor 2 family protein [Pyrinomonadaceae bacterium]